MHATPEPHGPVEPGPDEYERDQDGFGDTLPVRPRRPFLTKWSAGAMALVMASVGFYVGVRVEKNKIPATSSSAGSAFARAFAGAAGGTSGKSGAAGTFASRLGAGGAASLFGGSGGATVGSVASVNGRTLYVTETSGNTVKVKLSGQTTITKSEAVSHSKVFPGDEVVISGAKGAGGTIDATSVTDSGARSTGGSTSTGSTSGGSASSAISSLFGGG